MRVKDLKMKMAVFLWLMLMSVQAVQAAEVTITAEYREGLQFTNTTPQAAFCGRWPHYCVGVETVGLPITYTKETFQTPSPRDAFYIQLPPRRSVTVTNQQTGESYDLTFEIFAVSQHLDTPDGHLVPVYTQTVRGGCRYRYTLGPGGKWWAAYLWNVSTPANPGFCYSSYGTSETVVTSTVRDFGVAYRLVTPSPLKMKQGTYVGQSRFSVGPGGDFDFGNGVSALSSDSLTIHFDLDVVHAFVIDFPPGSDRVLLEPPGGWGQWLNNQRVPERLYRDLPMRIWSSGPFTVHARCQYPEGRGCGIRNLTNGHQVPVDVALSLPSVIHHNGQSVSRLPLPVGEAQALEFEATHPAINRGASLHFQVDKAAVREMTQYPGSRYEGDVTVVFDADF